MELYILRHGQTDINKSHRYNCRNDDDLNETGIRQAEEAGEEVARLPIDLIFCSPLARTRHTCRIANRNHVPVIIEPEIIERDGGVLTAQPLDSFDRNEYYNYYSTCLPEGVETVPELFARVHGFLNRLKETYPDKSILLVTHGGVARAIQFYFQPLPEDGHILNVSGMPNCSIVHYSL